jgi:alpha-galactosidase
MKNLLLIVFLLLAVVFKNNSFAQSDNYDHNITELRQCRAVLKGDTLTLENSIIKRVYLWNKGDIKSISLTDKKTRHTWAFSGAGPDAGFPDASKATSGLFEAQEVAATAIAPAHLEVSCTTMLGSLTVKRVFRIYPDCPAIACTFYLKGSIGGTWASALKNQGDLKNVESLADIKKSATAVTVMEQIAVPGMKWRLKSVQLFDITDQNNNLIQEYNQVPYRAESHLIGNLLFANETLSNHGIFILKEAPNSNIQLSYPGFDFTASTAKLQAVGIGVSPADINGKNWTRCYGFVTGVTSGTELDKLIALRTYQEKIRIHLPGRDDMILMNTWGDRNQDKHIGEAFTLKELEAGHRLGITHFQIDDGWQTGRSANSAFTGGTLTNIWANRDYWKPDKVKFPNGLLPVTKLANKLGIKVCLWFNPAKDSSYAHWQDDARALIDLYHAGIHTFKIDGASVSDKKGEVNLRKMFDTLMRVTNNQVVFNLDVTAGRRYGYNYFNEYGNIFLENRYTDFNSYYPFWTLRNLWMLSRYVPAQNLQIEFLNNNRNAGKYPADDMMAPSKVSFEYGFAITMMAQPLAWMEASNLPDKSFLAAPAIKKYQTIQSDIHKGRIFPIGNEPTGASWTGFQSIKGNTGYLLIIREYNTSSTNTLQTWLPARKKVKLKAILGSAKNCVIATDKTGSTTFKLPTAHSYALYSYQVL